MADYKLISSINKYCSVYSVLVVDKSGMLRKLDCPFTVVVIIAIDNYSVGDMLLVNKVKMDRNLKIVYIINNSVYFHTTFTISLND